MVKKQAFVVFLTVMSFIGSAFGLGLGDIEVKSNLNDPLEAEIELIQLQGLTAGEILPTLASNDDFRRAGVERSFFLSNIQFRVQETDSGRAIITLATRQAVREPFLNFLVEVNWPGGRLLKEYTVLLDPPVFDTGLAVDALVIESQDNVITPETDVVTTTVVTDKEKTETVTQTQPVEPREDNLPEGQYRVQRNDTLWEIALNVPGRDNYSPQQVMLAIQDLNPEAFLGDNINRLKAGSVLILPDGRQMSTRTLKEAIAEVQAQNNGASPNLRAPVSDASEVQLSATESTSSALPSAGGEKNPDGYLELTADADSSSTTASGEAGATVDQLQNQLAVAEELNDQFQRERDELESRVTELQEQIAIMERLLDVQNSDLAEVQQALGDDQAADTAPATQGATAQDSQSDDTQASAADTSSDAQDQPATDDSASSQSQAPVQPQSTLERILGIAREMSQNVSGWVLASITNMAITGGALLLLILLPLYVRSKKRGSGDQTLGEMSTGSDESDFSESDGMMADFDEDLLAEVEDDFDDDFESSEPETLDAVVEAEMYMAYQKYDQAEEKLKDAFSEHPDRVDVGLKLLEVYAETGDSNAFNELESRLNLKPDQRQVVGDLRAKLPIGGVTDTAGMESDDLTMDLDMGDSLDLDDGTGSDDDYGSDPDFGLDIDTETPSESEKSTSGTSDSTVHAAAGSSGKSDRLESEDSDLDFSLDLGDLDESTTESSDSDDLDFSLDDFDDETPDLNVSEDKDSAAGEEDLDFSLDLEESDTEDSSDDDVPSLSLDDDFSFDESELNADTGYELNLDDDSDDELQNFETGTETKSESDDTGYELNLDDDSDDELLNFETETETETETESDDTGLELNLDDDDTPDFDFGDTGDLSLDDDFETTTEKTPGSDQDDSSADALTQLANSLDSDADLEEDEFDFLSGNDEASTKLDLARAYIEMDDKEGARDILEEVVAEGNDEQKAQANELMNKL